HGAHALHPTPHRRRTIDGQRQGLTASPLRSRRMAVNVHVSQDDASIDNGLVRVELARRDGKLVERVLAWRGGWHPVVVSSQLIRDARLDWVPVLQRARLLAQSADEATLRLTGTDGARSYTVDVALKDGERALRYTVTEQLDAASRSRSLQSRYRFEGG